MAWKKGQSGNPKGKPKGRKDKLTITALDIKKRIIASWNEQPVGEEILRRVKNEEPVQYCKIIASLLPKDAEERQGIDLNISVGPDRVVPGNGRGNGRNGNGKRGPAKGRLSIQPE